MGGNITWSKALAWRMRRQWLVRRADRSDLVEVVSRLCGIHAQLTSSAELTLLARVEPLDRDALAEALWKQRTMVKLWAMRGTLHVLPSAELGVWLGGFAAYRHYGLTDPAIRELVQAVGEALYGRVLTRAELAAEIGRRTGSAQLAGYLLESWGSYLKPPSLRGKLCYASSEDSRVRFTHPATWVAGGIAEVDEAGAFAEIARRFLGGYGPATTEDIVRWWGGAASHVRRMLRGLADEVVEIDVSGERCWLLAEHVAELAGTGPARTVRLLPAFDPWVVGASRTAPAVLDPRFRHLVYRPQGWMSPVVLVDGRMRGVWTTHRTGSRLQVAITAFDRLPHWARRQAESEAHRLAEFAGRTPDVIWTE